MIRRKLKSTGINLEDVEQIQPSIEDIFISMVEGRPE